MKDVLYIIMPAYNEEANIKTVIEEWYPVIEKMNDESKLVIIDDGSKDSTYSIMQELSKDRPKFIPLTKPNGGHGPTVTYGYNYALENNADYVFQTDSDGQTRPNEFYRLWKNRKKNEGIFPRGNKHITCRIGIEPIIQTLKEFCFNH